MSASTVRSPRGAVLHEELRKVAAFSRRDLLVNWSYRTAFVGDWVNLLVQVVLFGLVGTLVDPERLSGAGAVAGGPTYLEFVSVGIAFTSLLQLGLNRSMTAMRNEQLMGTMESLLVTPTWPVTLQLGSVAFDLAYVPVRTAVFFLLTAGLFGAHYALAGLLPAVAVLLPFVAWVWGLGLFSAAAVLVLRRGAGAIGLGAVALVLTSNAYVPAEVLPTWLQGVVEANPITLTLIAARGALLEGSGWEPVWPALVVLVPAAAITTAIGVCAIQLALERERRRGTLGLY